jgi:mucin-19
MPFIFRTSVGQSQIADQNLLLPQVAIIVPNQYTALFTVMTNNIPWGIYDAADWNSTSNTLPENRGLPKSVTSAGTISSGSASGNGSSAPVSYIGGTTTSSLTWPAGSIPANFTICSITRYTGSTNNRRILQTANGNWLHGHWNAYRGVCFYEGWMTQNAQGVGTQTNWLVACGKNVVNSGSALNSILVDGVASGSTSGVTIAYTGPYVLSVNNNNVYPEYSDWQLSYVIIWDKKLTDAEMVTVSTALQYYLTSGIKISIPASIKNIYGVASISANSGATVSSNGSFTVFKFTSSGTFVVATGGIISVLLVGGGGAGGYNYGGGGGGGGVVYFDLGSKSMTITAGSYSITVGAGGTAAGLYGTNNYGGASGDTIFNGYTAKGGGLGALDNGSAAPAIGGSGGCGGGSVGNTGTASGGPSNQSSYANAFYSAGFAGGKTDSTSGYCAGGGGGAGAVGSDSSSAGAGAGGAGYSCNITGTSVLYGGGGGGGAYPSSFSGAPGGSGGGGKGGSIGTAGIAGTDYLGGGGGGASGDTGGGAGGKGVVIILCYSTA